MPDTHPTTAEYQARVESHETFINAQGSLSYRAFCTCGWSGTLGHELDAAKEAVAHEKTEEIEAALAKAVAHE